MLNFAIVLVCTPCLLLLEEHGVLPSAPKDANAPPPPPKMKRLATFHSTLWRFRKAALAAFVAVVLACTIHEGSKASDGLLAAVEGTRGFLDSLAHRRWTAGYATPPARVRSTWQRRAPRRRTGSSC